MADWRPSGDAATARRRATLLRRVHRFFARRGVLAVDTPALGAASVTDPNIASIAAGGGRWLQTSPEYYMKRLLAAGYPDIYAVCRVFRDGECGSRHLPEFTLVEWYRRGFDLPRIEAETTALIACALPGHFAAAPEYVEYRDAFSRHAGFDPLGAPTSALAAATGANGKLAATLGEDRDAWLDLLLATVVAPRFPADRLTVLRHYPASQAALARLCPDNLLVADRFEVFAGDLELANGYVELTDALEQARRMDRDCEIRHERGLPAMPRDRRLLAALAAGLPPAAGVALGFERLHMLADGASDIKNVVAFPGDLP